MKKLVSVTLALLVLFFCFMFTVSAADCKTGAYSISIPDEFINDKAWAEKNRYVDYWHNEDYTVEVMVWDEVSHGLFDVPYTEDGDICNGLNITEQIELYNVSSEDLVIDGENVQHYRRRLAKMETGEKIRFDLFKVDRGETDYNLSIFSRDKSVYHYIDEISSTLKIDPAPSFITPVTIGGASVLFLAFSYAVTKTVMKRKEK